MVYLSTTIETNLIKFSWRDIVSTYLDDHDSELFLDFSSENIFWRNRTVIVSYKLF